MKKSNFFIMAIIVLANGLACGDLTGEVKMKKEDKNKTIARLVVKMYDLDSNTADEIFLPNCVHHINGTTEQKIGPDAMKQSIMQMKESFVTSHTTIDDLLAENDHVAFRWTWVGKMKASGQDYTLNGNTIFRFENGKVAEQWAIDDRLREMQKLGFTLIPPASSDTK
jgi:predicted ester cyclase